MKKYILACVVCAAALARSADPVLESVEAHQRYPWNGLVNIDVTMSGASNDVVSLYYTFVATNSATAEVLPVAHVTAIPGAIGSDTTWTRRFVWDATADAGTVKIDGIDLSVIAAPGIQLWENGPCWAACNVGASEPEGYGYYFWWGDTVGCKRNAADTRWVKVSDETKFLFIDENCPTYGNDKSELQSAGWIDSTGKLVPAHDAATAYLGGSWRMPTSAEIKYLVDHCSSAWTTNNGVYGRLVTGLGAYASQSIFLPAAGNIFQSARDDDGVEGWYWSSTLFGDSVDPEGRLAFFVNFRTSDSVSWIGYNGGMRYCGGSVRPVLENPTVQWARVSFAFDGRKGERDSPSGQEVLRYSSRWNVGTNDAPTVTLRENGNLLAAGLTGEGGYDWTVPSNGTYVLTHTTYTGGVVVAIETACYRIPHGLYDIDPAMVAASPYAGTFDGLPHGISVTGPEGTAVKYCATPNGVYGEDNPVFRDVCNTQVWYEISGEGYAPYTNAVAVVIRNRPVTVTSGTKLDIDYDGMPHVYASLAVTAGSFVAGEGIATSSWATVTEGQVPNTFDYGPLEGTKLGNYSLSIVTGEIAVVDRRLRVEFKVGEYGTRSGGGALEQYIFSGAAAEAPEVTAAEGYRFTGWDVPFDVVTNALTVTAQYKAVAPEMFPGETFPLDASVDNTYNGFLYDEIGILAGVVQAKTGKAGRDGSVSVSAAVTWSADGKKLSLKGTMPSDKTEIALEDKKGTGTLTLRFGANGLSGTWKCSSGIEWTASGARNVFTAKDADSRSSAETAAQKYAGVWTVGFDTGSGWSVFSVVLDPKGKAKIAGTLAEGKKVSGTSMLVIGADTACVPVSLPKAGIAYTLWLSATGAVVKASDDVAAGTFAAKAGALSADAAFGIDVGAVTNACAEYARHHASEVDVDGTCALCPYLPNGVAVEVDNKGKWGVPKAGKVAYARGTTDIDATKLGENPSGLKLTYQAKTGLFNGSFKLYYVNGSGKVASQPATITGALIGGKGYGTAVIKKWNLRFPVTVGAE